MKILIIDYPAEDLLPSQEWFCCMVQNTPVDGLIQAQENCVERLKLQADLRNYNFPLLAKTKEFED